MDGKLIAITMGDPAGIGPEIIAKVFADPGFSQKYPAIVVGDVGIMRRAVNWLTLDLEVEAIEDLGSARKVDGCIQVYPASHLPEDLPTGKLDQRAGAAAFEYIRQAIELAHTKLVNSIVTAPINKEALHLAGYPYPGHTEILAELTGTRDYAMLLISDRLRVIHISTHVSLKKALSLVDKERELIVIRLANQALKKFNILTPRIAVAGLNPHAGEGQLFGSEEIESILPAIEEAKSEGINVTGPWPPDTVFMRAVSGESDIVVAQYHDQGHIPIKLLGFDTGVNVTVGLPFWRTSVDHGTAFDIAGTGTANPSSMLAAIELALKLGDSSST